MAVPSSEQISRVLFSKEIGSYGPLFHHRLTVVRISLGQAHLDHDYIGPQMMQFKLSGPQKKTKT